MFIFYPAKIFKLLDDFYILENDNICCHGKVHGPVDDILLLQDVLSETQNRTVDYEFAINKDDIYKDLRVRGYDYSGEFQKLIQIRTNDFQDILGECEWDGNPVSFLDNLLQAQILATPFRKLMVPVIVKNMRIDPKTLFEAVRHNKVEDTTEEVTDLEPTTEVLDNVDDETEKKNIIKQFMDGSGHKFCLFKSKLTFTYNNNTRILIAPGVEIENALAFPIPRRMPSSLVLDSYEWVANEDNSAINECDKQYIDQYIEV